jgi:hypothetical protein
MSGVTACLVFLTNFLASTGLMELPAEEPTTSHRQDHRVVLTANGVKYGAFPDELLNFATLLDASQKTCNLSNLPATGTLINPADDFQKELPCRAFLAYALLTDALDRPDVTQSIGREGLWVTMEQLNAMIYRAPPLTSSTSLRGFRDGSDKDSDNNATHCTVASQIGGGSCDGTASPPPAPQLPLVQRLVKHVNRAFRRANTFQSKLPLEALLMEGFSGTKTRHFYNNLCSDVIGAGRKTHYAEVGTFQGSSLVSTLFGNGGTCRASVVEIWSEFGGRNEFFDNMAFFNITTDVNVYEHDFFTFDVSPLDKIDVYLYDGAHTVEAHYAGIVRMWPALADQAIVVIDDWNSEDVRNGTFAGLADVGAHVEESWEVMYVTSGGHTPKAFAGQ